MTDDGICIVFIFFKEIVGSRESNLINVFIDFLSRKSQTTVGNGNRVFIYFHLNGQVAQFSFKLAFRSKCLQLLSGIDRIGYQFAEKNFMIAIQEFLDDGENVLCCNPDITFLHNLYIINVIQIPLYR